MLFYGIDTLNTFCGFRNLQLEFKHHNRICDFHKKTLCFIRLRNLTYLEKAVEQKLEILLHLQKKYSNVTQEPD